VQGALLTGRSRELEAMLGRATGVRLSADAAVIVFSDGSERALAAARPMLVEPGKPIGEVALAAVKQGAPASLPVAARGSAGLLPLPAAVRPGVRAASFLITSIERTDGSYAVRLARGAERVEVRLRAHEEGAPYTVRKGRWAVDVAGAHALGEPARAAIGALVRALPA
jgi:hypothetical protein